MLLYYNFQPRAIFIKLVFLRDEKRGILTMRFQKRFCAKFLISSSIRSRVMAQTNRQIQKSQELENQFHFSFIHISSMWVWCFGRLVSKQMKENVYNHMDIFIMLKFCKCFFLFNGNPIFYGINHGVLYNINQTNAIK